MSDWGIRQNLPWSQRDQFEAISADEQGFRRGCIQERRQGTRPSVCGVAAWHAIFPFNTTLGFSRFLKKEVGRVSASLRTGIDWPG